MKKKIDFRNIEVVTLNGESRVFDIPKELGNAIFTKTMDLGELELARDIYKSGEVEIDEAQGAILSRYIRECFLAFIQEAVCPQLDGGSKGADTATKL